MASAVENGSTAASSGREGAVSGRSLAVDLSGVSASNYELVDRAGAGAGDQLADQKKGG